MKRPALIIFVLLAMAVGGCKGKKVESASERVVNVKVEAARKVKLRPYVEAVGTLKPFDDVVVSAEAGGIVNEIGVEEGSQVSEGSLLARIDDEDYRIELERAEASVRQADATLTNARAEHQRRQSLYNENLATQQQLEAASTALSLAESQLSIARANYALARRRLSKTKITSPLAGVVSEKKVSRGTLVGPATPLFRVIRTNPLKIDFGIGGKDIGNLRVGQSIVFSVDAVPGKVFNAKVLTLYPAAEEKTRTFNVEAVGANPGGELKPGLFARLTIYTGQEHDAIAVPQVALLYEGETVRVFVVDGDRAREKSVKAGQRYTGGSDGADLIEVGGGLKEGERIIVVGQQGLFDGAKIKVE